MKAKLTSIELSEGSLEREGAGPWQAGTDHFDFLKFLLVEIVIRCADLRLLIFEEFEHGVLVQGLSFGKCVLPCWSEEEKVQTWSDSE